MRSLGFTEPELRDLYEAQQLSIAAIARGHGCSRSGVQSALIRYGIARRPRRSEPIYARHSFAVYRQASLDRVFELISPFMRHAKRRRDMLAAWDNVKWHRKRHLIAP